MNRVFPSSKTNKKVKPREKKGGEKKHTNLFWSYVLMSLKLEANLNPEETCPRIFVPLRWRLLRSQLLHRQDRELAFSSLSPHFFGCPNFRAAICLLDCPASFNLYIFLRSESRNVPVYTCTYGPVCIYAGA